jgi:hypothetical protein
MQMPDDDTKEEPEGKTPIDWEELRSQAAKLGISLSELQQKLKQQKLRVKKKPT